MPSLRHLLAAHAPLLLIDAASTRIQAGWLEDAATPPRWTTSEDEAGVGVFECIEKLGVELHRAVAFAFCEGPGSILGVRTSAMAIRTWNVTTPRPVFAYSSLAIVAHALRDENRQIIADARRESWHCLTFGSHLQRVPTAALSGALVMPDGFRNWTPLPPQTTRTPYSLSDLMPLVIDDDLFRLTDAPDAFLHEEPTYATWTPKIHRAP